MVEVDYFVHSSLYNKSGTIKFYINIIHIKSTGTSKESAHKKRFLFYKNVRNIMPTRLLDCACKDICIIVFSPNNVIENLFLCTTIKQNNIEEGVCTFIVSWVEMRFKRKTSTFFKIMDILSCWRFREDNVGRCKAQCPWSWFPIRLRLLISCVSHT